eukprot:TRINITY_DN4747_c0_g1_i1.p2 TRINITY_DN4747_c0_g1~~TRINITY_DN4747_c0_g1_i1.p2  ORF type:complete len:243 (+),score=111.37 TRINITY_DN4747_c0_g1_i1:42-731(+)
MIAANTLRRIAPVARSQLSRTATMTQVTNVPSRAAALRRMYAADAKDAADAADKAAEATAAEPKATDDAAAAAEPTAEQTLQAEIDELKTALAYAMAETENVRKRMQRDIGEAREFGMRSFAKDLLDVSDNFERALEAAKEDAERIPEVKTLYDGVLMTENQLHKVFQRHGVERFSAHGEQFDPNRHMALMEMEHEELGPGHVGLVIKSGFVMKDRVLRPAEVGVTKKK